MVSVLKQVASESKLAAERSPIDPAWEVWAAKA